MSSVTIKEEVTSLWNRPIAALPTFIDLGRLCKRIDVYVKEEKDQEREEPPSVISSRPSEDVLLVPQFRKPVNERSELRAQDLANAISAVAVKIESPEVNAKLPDILSKFVQDAGENLDYRLYVKELFNSAFVAADDSPLVKVFKLVNQAALFISIMHMKTLVSAVKTHLKPDDLMTKDVRTPDGWRVEIEISRSEVSVTHVRKDQCLGPPLCPDYWDVQWKFKTVFSPDIAQITSTSVVVQNMSFGAKIPPRMRAELKRVYYEAINGDFSFSDCTSAIEIGDNEAGGVICVKCCC